MGEQKLIDWDTLSENCIHYEGHKGLRVCCSHEDNEDDGCFRIDCPIWKNLDEVTLLEIRDIAPVLEGEE